MRAMLLVAVTFALAGSAVAQMTIKTLPTTRTPTVTPTSSAGVTNTDIPADPAQARALIQKLRADNHILRQRMTTTLSDLQELRRKLDATTTPGGSLVRASCSGDTLSRNTAGASEDCSASGYKCASVSGLCFRECTSTDQCAGGFVCDIPARRCVVPGEG